MLPMPTHDSPYQSKLVFVKITIYLYANTFLPYIHVDSIVLPPPRLWGTKPVIAAFLKLHCVSNGNKQANPEEREFKPNCNAEVYLCFG